MSKKSVIFWACAAVAVVIPIFLIKDTAGTVLFPVISALVQAYFFIPFVRQLEKRTNKNLAIILALTVTFVVNASVIILFGSEILLQGQSLAQNAPALIDGLFAAFGQQGESSIKTQVIGAVQMPGIRLGDIDFSQILIQGALLFITPVLIFFIVRDKERFKSFFVYLMPESSREVILNAKKYVDRSLKSYVLGGMTVMIVLGATASLVLYLVGFDYYFILGIATGILSVIPYFGPVFAALPVLLVALTSQKLLAGVIIVVALQVINIALLSPLVIGNKLKAHPLTVVLIVLCGNALFGIIGMLLAVPVYIILQGIVLQVYRRVVERAAL